MPARNVSRRDFIKASLTVGGALLITYYLEACSPDSIQAPPTQTAPPEPEPKPEFIPNLFVQLSMDGKVTLKVHRSEMGQGVRTSLAMILAEELDAKWEDIHVQQMDVTPALNQITSGSGSVAINYTPLREAGAFARQVLISAAANLWDVPSEECSTLNGTVTHALSNRSAEYGELVAAAVELGSQPKPQLKEESVFNIIGKSKARVDGRDIVTGKAIYGLDVRLPGMVFAVVAHCPVVGGKLLNFDASKAESVPGVKAVVQISRGVAVVAENTWSAIQGRNALSVIWDEGPNANLSTESLKQRLAEAVKNAVESETAALPNVLQAEYETPFLAHATMEPVNCVADVREDTCEIWAPTQNPLDVQKFVQNIVRVPTNVHVTLLGGGFGRKLEVDYPVEAAEISKAIKAPVQVVWTREDDIQNDFYRQITHHSMKAGWDTDGKLQLWRHYISAPGINGIAYRVGKEVLDEGLALLYDVPNELPLSFLTNTPVPTGPWRGVLSSPNAFANECFMDEIAYALHRDPYELRLEYVQPESRIKELLDLATGKSNWSSLLPEGYGRGLAGQTYHQVTAVMVAEVSVINRELRVHKVICAIDCGKVINPDMVMQQIEGSIAYGLSTLKSEITHKNGRVQQNNFYDYPILQLREMPDIEVYVLPSEASPQGLGEMGVPPIVPAVMNAIFDATGKRIRHTPIREGDL